MKLNYETQAKAIFGILLSYDEIKHLKQEKEYIDLFKSSKSDNMMELWSEINYDENNEWEYADYACPYYDTIEKDAIYYLGYQLTHEHEDITILNDTWKEKIIKIIKQQCNKLNITYEEPKFYILPHII